MRLSAQRPYIRSYKVNSNICKEQKWRNVTWVVIEVLGYVLQWITPLQILEIMILLTDIFVGKYSVHEKINGKTQSIYL